MTNLLLSIVTAAIGYIQQQRVEYVVISGEDCITGTQMTFSDGFVLQCDISRVAEINTEIVGSKANSSYISITETDKNKKK